MKNKITISLDLPVSAKKLYSAWLSSTEHTAFTGSPAKASARKGANFSAWDGYIYGTTTELTPYKHIVQKWRTTEFPQNAPDSRLDLFFTENSGGTTLTLEHSNVPSGQSGEYKKGWKKFYFVPMKKYFTA